MRAVVAMVEGPAASRDMHLEFPDCTACVGDRERRARWGCDGEATEPVFSVTCSGCEGRGCEACGGTGEVSFRRCPARVLDQAARPDLVTLVHAVYDYSELGLLPASGGTLDQTMAFAQGCRVVTSARNALRREVDEFMRKERSK